MFKYPFSSVSSTYRYALSTRRLVSESRGLIQILLKFREISLTALPRRRPAQRPRSCPRCLPRGGRCSGSGRTSAGVPEVGVLALELQTNHRRSFHNHGECPSLLGPKILLRHYAKWVLTCIKYLNSCEMETPRQIS